MPRVCPPGLHGDLEPARRDAGRGCTGSRSHAATCPTAVTSPCSTPSAWHLPPDRASAAGGGLLRCCRGRSEPAWLPRVAGGRPPALAPSPGPFSPRSRWGLLRPTKHGRRIPRPAGSPRRPVPTARPAAAAWRGIRARGESEQWSRFWKSPVPLNRIKLTVPEEPQRSGCLPMGCSCWQRRGSVPLLWDSPGGCQSLSCPRGRFTPSQGGERAPSRCPVWSGGRVPREGRAAALGDVRCH